MPTSSLPPAPHMGASRFESALQAAACDGAGAQGKAKTNAEKVREQHDCFFREALLALSAVARAINASDGPEVIVGKMAAELRPWLPCTALSLSIIEGEVLRCIGSSDLLYQPQDVDFRQKPDHALVPLLRGEIGLDSRGVLTGVAAAEDAVSMSYIHVPMTVDERIYGLLHIDRYPARAWSERELQLAALVAQQFAAVLQGALGLQRLREREAELAQTLALLGATQEAAAEGICLVDTRGELVSYNRRFAALWNISPDEARHLEREAALMSHVLAQLEDPDEFIAKIGELYDNPHALARDEVRLRNGRIFERYSAPAIAPALSGEAETNFGRVWTFSDISDRKLYESQLQHQAFHDALTGLPNRALLTQRLERALLKLSRSHGTLAVLFLDLDRFKIVNDSLGHEKGDKLLQQVAARLQNCLRPGDLAARFGGDEFVILLEEVGGCEAAVLVAQRVAQALQYPFLLDGHEVTVTSSVGIVLGQDAGEPPHELLRKADIAMYRAKNSGKAQFYLWNENVAHGQERLQLEIELQSALGRGELEVWYQPIIDLRAGQHVCGYEALVRWRHPARGLISPAEFIPIAEENGLILQLDAWVLQRACAQISLWNAARPAGKEPLSLHVNLSARQFEQPDVAVLVARVLEEYALPGAQLVLEITESAIMLDTGSAIAQLGELKKLGVGISIDDFGTGHSSLAYLEFLPVDSFKIDRAFVARLCAGTAIVRAVVSLAQALNVEVVAEGVETPQQLEQLRALGCRWAQGFWFAKPLPPDQIQLPF